MTPLTWSIIARLITSLLNYFLTLSCFFTDRFTFVVSSSLCADRLLSYGSYSAISYANYAYFEWLMSIAFLFFFIKAIITPPGKQQSR